jgi:hypothetical protein
MLITGHSLALAVTNFSSLLCFKVLFFSLLSKKYLYCLLFSYFEVNKLGFKLALGAEKITHNGAPWTLSSISLMECLAKILA